MRKEKKKTFLYIVYNILIKLFDNILIKLIVNSP